MSFFRYIGKENADPRFHDGTLRPVMGAHNIQVMRANREHPEWSQGFGFTYNHAPMLCRWRGKMYLMYLTSPVHEHDGLARAMLTESADGYVWSFPRIVFPEIPVPAGVYRGKGAEKLPSGALTVVHHRMGFYCASNGVLLVLTFHGVSPDIHIAPNSGWGMGRVVRRVFEDGTLGGIFVLRINEKAGWKPAHFPYPVFTDSEDEAFREACRDLLSDPVANGAWWEEERLDEDFFSLKNLKAPCFCPLPDGKTAVIGKMGLTAVSSDRGKTWSPLERMEGLYTSTGKCAWFPTADGKYTLACNPTPDSQHRWPLSVMTSSDGYTYDQMGFIAGEVSPQRYGGELKNYGPQYVRCIMPGNDDAGENDTWLAYSMNKEDIWVVRLPGTIRCRETEPVHDVFSQLNTPLPEKWYIHSPLWARVAVENGCLTLRDSDPYEYAKAVRLFPETGKAVLRLRLKAQELENGELHIEVSDEKGLNAIKMILRSDGKVSVVSGHEWVISNYANGEMLDVAMSVDCENQRISASVNGQNAIVKSLMNPCRSVDRLTLRTGPAFFTPTLEDNVNNIQMPDVENAGERGKEAVYSLFSLDVDE